MVGCGKTENVLETEVIEISTEEVIESSEEASKESVEEIVEELISEEELLAALNEERLANAELKINKMIEVYKQLFPIEYDNFAMYMIESEDFVMPTSIYSQRTFKNGETPRGSWTLGALVIHQFINIVNKGETELYDGAEWLLKFEDEEDFRNSQYKLDIYGTRSHEEEGDVYDEYYMHRAVEFAATLAQNEGLITFGEIVETEEIELLNGMKSNYSVQLFLNGQDYGLTAYFDVDGNLLNIYCTGESQRDVWFYNSR